MPSLRGSLTYARFFVEGDLPADFSERFVKAVRLRAMRPLEPDEEDLERSGWCRIGEPFALDLTYESIFYNEHLVLGFRTDRFAIPGPMLRSRMREAEQAYLQKKGRERLSRREKTELKDLVTRKLKKQIAPTTRAVDLTWSLNEGLVRFFSHAEKGAGAMTELFTKTFGLRLVPESPYTLAARLGLSRAQERAWQDLDPISLAEGDDGARHEEEEVA